MLILYLFLDFSIEIEQPWDQNPEIGSDAEFICRIDSRSPYTNPIWYNQDGDVVANNQGNSGYDLVQIS